MTTAKSELGRMDKIISESFSVCHQFMWDSSSVSARHVVRSLLCRVFTSCDATFPRTEAGATHTTSILLRFNAPNTTHFSVCEHVSLRHASFTSFLRVRAKVEMSNADYQQIAVQK